MLFAQLPITKKARSKDLAFLIGGGENRTRSNGRIFQERKNPSFYERKLIKNAPQKVQ